MQEKVTKNMSGVDLSMIVMIMSIVIHSVFRELVMRQSEIALSLNKSEFDVVWRDALLVAGQGT
jgi:hypothetical protein